MKCKSHRHMRIKRWPLAITGIILLTITALASAQKLVDISSCAGIAKDAERFACYDNLARQAGALPPAQAAQSAQPAPAVTTPPAQAQLPTQPPASAQTSVVAPAAASQNSPAPVKPTTTSDPSRIAAFGAAISKALLQTDTDGQEMLLDTVTAARYYKPDIWQLTLSSGQVWRQMNAQVFTLRVGDKVQIAPSGWGKSYRLTVQGRSGFIQVERLDNKAGK